MDTGHDYRALDRLMPHPTYAPMAWVCVLNPSEATLEGLAPLVREACARAAGPARARLAKAAREG